MPYDLYDNSYKTALEASNAEMAQCADIDSRINNQRIKSLEAHHANYNFLCQHIQDLENRVEQLEQKLKTT